MIKAEIRQDANMIKTGETLCISLKEIKKHARTRLAATVILSGVEFVSLKDSGRMRGTLMGDYDKKIELSDFEIPESVKKRFREISYSDTDKNFFDSETLEVVTKARTVYATGDKYYYVPAK